jgi:hypothetical protein
MDRDGTTARCLLCGNPGWHDRGAWRECTHCGLTLRTGADAKAVRASIDAGFARGTIDLATLPAGDWRVDRGGLRNMAWAMRHEIVGYVNEIATLRRAAPCPHEVTLAIMGRASESAAIAGQIAALSDHFRRMLVLIDGSVDAALLQPAEVACHPLDGDFGAQRNRLQAMAGTGWVLQLDTDEMPSPELLEALGRLTAAADRDGLRSLGLPRRNLVDGVLSALYPDIQYRLNRADVRFAGTVHERPVVPFAETSLALAGAIEHRLSAARVRARTHIYEGMASGGGRPEDEQALLRPYWDDPIADR